MGQSSGVLAQRVWGTVNVVHVLCVDQTRGLQSMHGGGRRHTGVAQGRQPPERSNLPLVGRWQRPEEERSVVRTKMVIWMQAGKCGRV